MKGVEKPQGEEEIMVSYFSLLPPLSRFTNLLAPLKFRGGFSKTRLQETQFRCTATLAS